MMVDEDTSDWNLTKYIAELWCYQGWAKLLIECCKGEDLMIPTSLVYLAQHVEYRSATKLRVLMKSFRW